VLQNAAVPPEPESLKGQLLVASPALLDPNFRRAVLLVTEHTDEGAMGLVLSRPTTAEVADAAPPLQDFVEEGARIFVGGPVEPAAVVVLAEFEDPSEAAALVFEDVGFVSGDVAAGGEPPAIRRARVFAGYSGWGAGQLEAELEEPSWILEPAVRDDVFSEEPEGLWSAVLRRKGGQFAILATMPPDPSMN
jgi:putative transcriptional regulator